MPLPFTLFPRDALNKIKASNEAGGEIELRHVVADDFYVLKKIETTRGLRLPVEIGDEYKRMHWGDTTVHGQWRRVNGIPLHEQHWHTLRRPGTVLDYDQFRQLISGVQDPGNISGILVTHQPVVPETYREHGASEFAAWLIHRDGVLPISVATEPEVLGLDRIADTWPLARLQGNSIMLVGCGSIGGAAAQALAAYGVGRLELVDPDRYLWHNVFRHVLPAQHVGRHKVDALATDLAERWPLTTGNPHALNVVEDAHHVRPLIKGVDLVLCAADGIAPRRVVSHLARRAKIPAVLACVLDNGSVGEIIRLRPNPRSGCLLCLRHQFAEQGAMDAEADQELDYGTGLVHQPMTAVPTDLHHVGIMAAKIAVATLLETLHGDSTQQLPGEHAIVGLRPTGDLTPPFDLHNAGEVQWSGLPPPRPDCPTCGSR